MKSENSSIYRYTLLVFFRSKKKPLHVICSTKARQDILVFVTNHENLLRLLVPGYLSARFVGGIELWWEVDISACPYRTRWDLPNSQ